LDKKNLKGQTFVPGKLSLEHVKHFKGDRQARAARCFLLQKYQNGGKYTKLRENYVPNGHKIYQMAVKSTKQTEIK
jgi:hypothetical protein